MSNTTNSLVSGIDPASFSAVTGPAQDLFRFVNGPWIDMYRLPDDRSRYGSFDKLAEDAENQIRDILEEEDCPATKSRALYKSFLDVDAIDKAGLSAIESQLDAIDKAEDKTSLTRALGAMNPTGGPDLLGIAVYGDPGAPRPMSSISSRTVWDCRMRPTTARTITRRSARRTSIWSPSS